jgi:myosin heavy subunit
MQEQTQNDKLVPIDTSGDPVEVELKEAKEDQVSQPDVQVEQVQTETVKEEGKEEELEEYSQSVKRRIDKLTRKMREAERRESAAIEYAKNVNEKLKRSETLGVQKDERSIKEGDARIKTQEEFTKRAMEAAIQAQDVEKQVAAQQQLAKLELERERLRASERRLEREKTEPKEEINVDQYIQQQAPQQQQQPEATDEARDWAEKNTWFNKDRVMTASAMVIHQDLAEEGFDLNSEDYYNEISKRIRKEFPHKFEGSAKPTQRVASAVRTNTASGRRTVKLTPSQVAIAKKLGVPLEEYAKHVKEA